MEHRGQEGAWQANFPLLCLLCGLPSRKVFLSSLPEKSSPRSEHICQQPVCLPAHREVCLYGSPLPHIALPLSLLHFPFFLTLTVCLRISHIKHQHFNPCLRFCFPEDLGKILKHLLINLAVTVSVVFNFFLTFIHF